MKVKELIELLQKENQEMDVAYITSGYFFATAHFFATAPAQVRVMPVDERVADYYRKYTGNKDESFRIVVIS